jgi:hypothetical protein
MPGFMDELAIYVISLISLPPFWFWEVSNQWWIVAALAGAQSFFLCLLMNEGLMKGGGSRANIPIGAWFNEKHAKKWRSGSTNS